MRRLLVAFLAIMALSASTAYGKTNSQLIHDTHVNGLCGKGFRVCLTYSIKSAPRYYAGGGWWVYQVEYSETTGLGPWGTRRCHVNRVSVRWGRNIGTPLGADYCWR